MNLNVSAFKKPECRSGGHWCSGERFRRAFHRDRWFKLACRSTTSIGRLFVTFRRPSSSLHHRTRVNRRRLQIVVCFFFFILIVWSDPRGFHECPPMEYALNHADPRVHHWVVCFRKTLNDNEIREVVRQFSGNCKKRMCFQIPLTFKQLWFHDEFLCLLFERCKYLQCQKQTW